MGHSVLISLRSCFTAGSSSKSSLFRDRKSPCRFLLAVVGGGEADKDLALSDVGDEAGLGGSGASAIVVASACPS